MPSYRKHYHVVNTHLLRTTFTTISLCYTQPRFYFIFVHFLFLTFYTKTRCYRRHFVQWARVKTISFIKRCGGRPDNRDEQYTHECYVVRDGLLNEIRLTKNKKTFNFVVLYRFELPRTCSSFIPY